MKSFKVVNRVWDNVREDCANVEAEFVFRKSGGILINTSDHRDNHFTSIGITREKFEQMIAAYQEANQ